jgi:hypothetical protein
MCTHWHPDPAGVYGTALDYLSPASQPTYTSVFLAGCVAGAGNDHVFIEEGKVIPRHYVGGLCERRHFHKTAFSQGPHIRKKRIATGARILKHF